MGHRRVRRAVHGAPGPAAGGRRARRPYDLVLEEHHRRLVAALRRVQQRGEAAPGRGLDDLADALVGFYLSRLLCRRRLDDWALTAIATIVSEHQQREDHR